MKTQNNIKVGKPDTKPSLPAHTKGVVEGNEPGKYEQQPGHLPQGKATARRSTGIDADRKNPIDPRMPNLSPA